MLIRIHPKNPESRLIQRVAGILHAGGIIVYPTDSVYAVGCNAQYKRTVERLYQVSRAPKSKLMTLLCHNFSQIATYAKVSQFAFRVIKHHFPGPYVFVLSAGRMVPKLLVSKRKTIGVRIPSSPIARDIVTILGGPLLTTSVKDEEGRIMTDPEEIYDFVGAQVDVVIDGGLLGSTPSSVVNLVGDEVTIVREGKGDLVYFQ